VGRHLIAAAAGVVLFAGCGPTPPQAPGPQAHQLNESLSGMSTACGEAAQIQAFSKDAHAMATTEQQAEKQIPALVRVYRQNPNWIFQGKSVAQLVVITNTYLDECGLHAAAKRLRQATSG
jgi:hypothetical protein